MKRKVFACTLIAIVISLFAFGTQAYFTYEDTARNVITTGSVGIAIDEKTYDDNQVEIDFPKEGVETQPGNEVAKIVKVNNNGKSDAWVRIELQAFAKDSANNDLPPTLPDGTMLFTFETLSDWILHTDGYYYYKNPVKPDELTSALFEKVKINDKLTNDYNTAKLILRVNAQAVQTANNGETVLEASGWPENN
ncbi:MAG: hypothetical protein IJ462_02740 [Clostridia bacterium]|nr:hypothetical protein [Clostridia bacterium]